MRKLILPLFILSVAGCKPKVATVPTYQITRGSVVSTLTVDGRIEASQRAVITAPYDAIVTKLNVTLGQKVQPGQALVILDPKSLQERIRTDHAKLADLKSKELNLGNQFRQANRDANRLSLLLQSRSIAASDLEQKQLDRSLHRNDLEATKAQIQLVIDDLSSLEKEVADSELKTPMKGVVTATWVQADQFVSGTAVKMGDSLITISGGGFLTFRATVREQDVLKLRTGMHLKVSLNAVENRTWPGQLTAVDDIATIDPNTGVGTFRVVVRFEATDVIAKSGMEASGSVVLGQRDNVLFVPKAAVRRKDGKSSVLIRQGPNKFTDLPIEVGLIGDTSVEVLKGLEEEDVIAALYDPGN